MNRISALSFLVVLGGISALIATTAQSQVGPPRAVVNLQPATPGISQSGHANINGTLSAGGINSNSFKLGATASAGDVLTTDANGNGTWQAPPSAPSGQQRVYRWVSFGTYDQSQWAMENDQFMFGGIHPSTWTDNNATANMLSPNSDVLRTFLTQKGTIASSNGMLFNQVFNQVSSTNGLVYVCLFRIANTTGKPINWTPWIRYTAYSAWSEMASCALNGALVWSSGTTGSTSFVMSIPANATSTVIFVATSGFPTSFGSVFARCTRLGFYNNSLALPSGLEFVDDFDTMP